MRLTGIHHVSSLTGDAASNKAFYTGVMGMRLVKKTVNQDDTSAYHLFYADGVGSPGTDFTFFDYPSPRERRGTQSIARTGLRVASEASLEYWAKRLTEHRVEHGGIVTRDDRLIIDCDDPEGQRLSLVVDVEAKVEHPWPASPVPAEHQIVGLGPVTLSVYDLAPTDAILKQLMGMQSVRQYASTASDGSGGAVTVHVYQMAGSGPAAELHVIEEPKLPRARSGVGAVHHVAFRVPTFAEYDQWDQRLRDSHIPFSGQVDRFYFRSLYFREPNGILFELATDGPGFAADEPIETLGEKLALPPFLEPRRQQIEAGLPPL